MGVALGGVRGAGGWENGGNWGLGPFSGNRRYRRAPWQCWEEWYVNIQCIGVRNNFLDVFLSSGKMSQHTGGKN